MKKSFLTTIFLALILSATFSTATFGQHDGYFMPSFTDSLTYLPSFNYPDSLKERQSSLDVEWALRLGIQQLQLINNEKASLFDSMTLKVVNETGEEKFVTYPNFWKLNLELVQEAPSDESGYTNHKGDGLLDKTFYAFMYRDEMWVLHKGVQARCDCPSKVTGYVILHGKRIRMLNQKELTRAIAAAHQADKQKPPKPTRRS